MFDWFLLLVPCLCGIISALLFAIRTCVEANKREQLKQKFDEDIIDSVNRFQKVAHDFPNNKVDKNLSKLPTNCKNCGAPLHGHICQFCDTEYN